ncbi:YceI domain-containing protein [Rubrivivax sp. A210]|uniref:YceI family protein n=1 Tax=Rubrivivax sp. A210 TaxID=2772301 RepID=UPI00191AB27C|nr:YceI family protein [Rubrivivax sp. A210]CAD5374982.1 YceI domain-containing protein [Rubrivivax sp. A210]
MKSFFALTALAALCAAAVPAMAAADTYAIDPTHTFVTFEVPHFGTSTNRGRFDKKEGSVQFDRAGKSGKVEITIDATSINTGTAQFNGHLQSADFFDTKKHATIKFVGDKFSFNGDKVTEVAGTLTLLGKTGPVVLKATNFNCYPNPMLKREVCGGDFETTVTRSKFGMNWGLDMGVPDAVRLVIQVEAVKQ